MITHGKNFFLYDIFQKFKKTFYQLDLLINIKKRLSFFRLNIAVFSEHFKM